MSDCLGGQAGGPARSNDGDPQHREELSWGEVNSQVLEIVEQKGLSRHRLGATAVVEKMGVRDARELRFEYAWKTRWGRVITTVWAEFVQVHG